VTPLPIASNDVDTQIRPSVAPREAGTVIPLSWEQEQIWLHGMLLPESPLYTETIAILYRGELDVAALESSLEEISRRHEIWRTTVKEHNGTPHQVVGAAVPIKARLFDLSAEIESLRQHKLDSLVADFARRPFDLARGPLVRVAVVRFGHAETRIFLTLHHLLFDGASLRQTILPELVELYAAYSTGRASTLAPVKLQYADYACWQRANPEAREAALDFWRTHLADLSPLSLPVDHPRHAETSKQGASHLFSFDKPLTDAVLAMARRERTTAFTALLASFIVLLARSCDTSDVTLGTVYGGRADTELESVLGCFLNILLLRTDLTGDPSFREVLKRVRGVTLDALENAAAPFQQVVRETLPNGSTGDSPVQAVFSFQPPGPELPAAWDLDVFQSFNGCAKFDLHMEVEQKNGMFRGRLMYNTSLFDAETIEALMQRWQNLIRAAIEAPEASIWKLNLLNQTEQQWLLNTVNATIAEIPPLCMHDLFVQKAAEVPESIAVSCQGRTLTYAQLEDWSARIAFQLRDHGVAVGSVVGLMVDRSPEMLAGLLGILRAGAAYVPLDPTYPTARLEHMLLGSRANLLLTQSNLIARLPEPHPPILDIADCLAKPAGPQLSNTDLPRVPLTASAYIIFTSGSTGRPKGVEIPHLALTNFLTSMQKTPGIEPNDVLLAVTSICFDIAALELYLPLTVGAHIELATAQDATDPDVLAKKLSQSDATIMQATPASWRMLIDDGWTRSQPLKILCGGEAMTKTLARQLLQRSTSVWNMYGPTETTIWSSCVQLHTESSQVTLGDPIANTSLFVLDAHQTLVPAGISGELYIGGAGLAKGYCHQPDLTGERFPSISLDGGPPVRLYRTGDRVKRLRDGSIVFLGRTDRQIKLNGFRIELGEIEQVLASMPAVQQSIVVQTHHPSHGEILAAYIVPKADASLHVEEIRAHMARSLPKYMQPTALHLLAEVPLTLNGKLDRSRLPALVAEEASEEIEQPLPGTEQTLAAIWREVLGVKAVGRQDNFFDHGGHSLEAVRFVSIASRAFARKIPFASFIAGPSIAQFAQFVRGHSGPKTQLLKRSATDGKQLLWIGGEPWLTRFARHLNDDLTLYAITPDVEPFTNGSSECTIEAMADQILANVREVQPEGPYLLGGFCLRSLLAYEVAQRLHAEGHEIGLLILGDLYAPGLQPKWTPYQRIVRRVHRESCSVANVVRSAPGDWLSEIGRVAASWVRLVTATPDPDTLDELLQALYKAELRYAPASFSGKVMFLESGESSLVNGSTVKTWETFIHDVDLLRYPGIHEDLLKEPNLRIFAERVGRSIEGSLQKHKDTRSVPNQLLHLQEELSI
jgi:amino acid adenylation domain-containing protein